MPAENNRGVQVANTVADIAQYEQTVRERLQAKAVSSSGVDAARPDEVDTRQLLPDEDLESGSDNGWSGDAPVWVQDLSGGSADAYNATYEIDSSAGADEKVVAIFAITNKAADPITTEIKFSTATGGEFERLQVEGLLTDEQDTLLLADPIVFGPTESGSIEQYVTAASDGEGVILHGITAEATGETLEASERFLSDL